MNSELLRTIVVALLGAGGATFIWTVAKSYLAIRDSAEVREDRAVARLEKFEADCREQLVRERAWSAYWQRVAGLYLYALNTNGIPEPPLPSKPTFPSSINIQNTTKGD